MIHSNIQIIKFEDDNLEYDVVKQNYPFLICTRSICRVEDADLIKGLSDKEIETLPIYTIVDLENNRRGPGTRLFNSTDFTNDEDLQKLMDELLIGAVEVSRRNSVDLNIELYY